jgi:hypothetical protein
MKAYALRTLIETCRYEPDVDRQIEILREVNAKLPKSKRLRIPSLFTDDYIRKALDIIEERHDVDVIER